jgi:hypothetical protein
MIEVNITQEEVEIARAKATKMGELRNSITKGKGNVIGFLGEMLFARHFGGTIVDNNPHYDVILDDKKVEIKTKATNYKPKDYFYASVANTNTTQKCDYYYFVRIMEDFSKAWLLGGYEPNKFYNDAIFYKKGEIDPTSKNGYRFTVDCYNIEIGKLKGRK